MNKKGFTLVELILVIVIIGIITLITTTGILDALEKNRAESAKAVEKMLINDLKMYNIDTEEDYWCTDKDDSSAFAACHLPGDAPRVITIEELLNTNQDINLGECLINGDMTAAKANAGYYIYTVKIICSKEITKDKKQKTNKFSTDGYTLNTGEQPVNVYYKTSDA